MDIEQARTFLEIIHAGSFIKASQRMHITQTAVTARIQALEGLLGCQLFIRNRSGAKLTPKGETFVEYATTLVQTWTLAKNHLNLPSGSKDCLALGAETSLWNPLMLNWVIWMKEHLPELSVSSTVENAPHLTANLERGFLDAALLHRPTYRSGFTVEQVPEEKLIHVCVPGNTEPTHFINWGEDFIRQFDIARPHLKQSRYSFNLGQHALQMMLHTGGNGWFRTRVVAPYLQTGVLERINNSPEFTYPIYLSYRSTKISVSLLAAMEGLKTTIASEAFTIV